MQQPARVLSSQYHELLSYLSGDVERTSIVELSVAGLPAFMAQYPYAYSCWPIVISREFVCEIAGLGKEIPALIKKGIYRRIQEDKAQLLRETNASPLVLDIYQRVSVEPSDLIIRYDVVLSDGCPKIIEVNVGSSVGGWQLDWLDAGFRSLLGSTEVGGNWKLRHRNTLLMFIEGAALRAKKMKPYRAEIRVALVDKGVFSEFEGLREALDQALASSATMNRLGARLLWVQESGMLNFSPDHVVRCGDLEIDALALPDDSDPLLMVKLMESAVAQKLHFLDSPLHTFFGNKHLLAMLHDDIDHFTESEQATILRHVPFSFSLQRQSVGFDGQVVASSELLVHRQADFVVKKKFSRQGLDVFIGRSMSPPEWREIVERYAGNPEWLAQQYCSPDPVSGSHKTGGCADYQMVWGLFYSHGEYAGCFVRAVEYRETGADVINSANGAVEFFVFEEDMRRNAFIL